MPTAAGIELAPRVPPKHATAATTGGGGMLKQWVVIDRTATPAERKAFKQLFTHYDGRTNWTCTPVIAWRGLYAVSHAARQGFEAAGCTLSAPVKPLENPDHCYYGTGTMSVWLSHAAAWLCNPEGKSQGVLLTADFLMLAMRQCLSGAYSTESLPERPHYGVLLASGLRNQRVANRAGLTHHAKMATQQRTTTTRLADIVTLRTTPTTAR